MKYGELSLAGVIVIVLFGMRSTPTGTNQGSAGSSVDKTSSAAHDDMPTPPVWKELCKLNPDLGANADFDKAIQTIPEGAKDPNCIRDLPPDFIVSAIATVPDPVTTNLGLLTDRTIESIQTAAAEAEYIPYLEALPWPVQNIPSKQVEAGASSHPGMGDKQTPNNDVDRQYPGVLIFRDSSKRVSRPKYLAVFLVSETPTAGLSKEQVFAALRIIGNIPQGSSGRRPRKVQVAGPFFSGSVASLKEIAHELSDRAKDPAKLGKNYFADAVSPVRCLEAFSGTITNPGIKMEEEFEEGCGPLLVEGQTRDLEALTLFTHWAEGLSYEPSQIAVLTEEGTKYGANPQAKDTQAKDEILRLHFPRGISSLRNATDPGQKASADAVVNAGPKRLQLRWQDVQPMSGETPLYGGYQTSLSQETVLVRLAETLRNKDIRLLGIMASDPWDVTFLIHWFTEASPNVRLFVRDNDLLYLRTPDVGSVTGIIALNDQPLIDEQQFGSGAPGALTLPSSSEEGQYNAFTRVLENLEPPVVDANKLEKLEDDKLSRDSSTQHLWVAATGTQGFLPLEPLPGTDNWKGRSAHALNVGAPSLPSIILWLLIASMSALHAFAAISQDRAAAPSQAKASENGKPTPYKKKGDWRKILPPMLELPLDLQDRTDPITVAKLVCHAMALCTAAFATLIAGGSFVFFWRSPAYWFRVLSFLAVAVVLLLLCAAVRCYLSARRIWTNGRKEKGALRKNELIKVPRLLRAGILVSLLPLGGIGAWSYSIASSDLRYAFMHFRNLHLGSGIAPTIPILILVIVFYLGIWVYLQRLSCWEFGTIEMPILEYDAFPGNCNPEVNRISRAMLELPDHPWPLLMFACPILLFVLFRPWSTMDMLEPRWVALLAISGLLLALMVLSVNWFRFMFTWREMERFLRKLEKLPLRGAFSRISQDSRLSIWGWNVAPGKLLPVREGVETLKAFARLTHDDPVKKEVREELFTAIRSICPEEGPSRLPDMASSHRGTPVEQQEGESAAKSHHDVEENAQERHHEWAVGAEGRDVYDHSAGASPNPAMNQRAVATEVAPCTEGGNGHSAAAATVAEQASDAKKPQTPSTSKDRLHQARVAMTNVINLLVPYVTQHWKDESYVGTQETPLPLLRRKEDSQNRPFELAEDLIALRYYSYIRYVGTELRRLLIFVVLAFSLVFVALHSYSFRASRALDLCFITTFVILGLGIVLILGQQERSILLSKLQGSTEGQLGSKFYVDVLKYAALPGLALLVSQVPSISNFILRWVQPNLDAFR
jgi:hypothetical protein